MNSFLARERYIRIGGVLMLASPFVNLAMSISANHVHPRPWSAAGLMLFFKSLTWITWALSASSIVVGFQMLKGRRSTWALVLLVIGCYIVLNAYHLRRSVRAEGFAQPLLQMAINIALFSLVFIQEYHQQSYGIPPEAKIEPPLSFQPKSPIRVDFVGVGPWAEVIRVSEDGLHMRSTTGMYPEGIETATVEMLLPDGRVVRARFSERRGRDFLFSYLNREPRELVERWSKKAS